MCDGGFMWVNTSAAHNSLYSKLLNYGKICIILFDPNIAHNTIALLDAMVTSQISVLVGYEE